MPAIKPFFALCVAACAALCIPSATGAVELQRTAQPVMYFGGVPGKAVVDTIDLMGPGGLFPYRGDFEWAAARPTLELKFRPLADD